MSHFFRDKALSSDSKRHNNNKNNMPVRAIRDLTSPFHDPPLEFSDSDLRETAYEILVGACRSSGGRPLTYIPQSEKTDRAPAPAVGAPSLQRSLTANAASKVKKALGMKSVKKRGGGDSAKVKRAVTAGELVRVQMRVSEQTDSRIRRALLRVAAGQRNRENEL